MLLGNSSGGRKRPLEIAGLMHSCASCWPYTAGGSKNALVEVTRNALRLNATAIFTHLNLFFGFLRSNVGEMGSMYESVKTLRHEIGYAAA